MTNVRNEILSHVKKYGNKAIFVACTLLEDAARNGKMNTEASNTLKQSFKCCLREDQERLTNKMEKGFQEFTEWEIQTTRDLRVLLRTISQTPNPTPRITEMATLGQKVLERMAIMRFALSSPGIKRIAIREPRAPGMQGGLCNGN